MTKKHITMSEALQKTDEQYARLKAEIDEGFRNEAKAHECSECATWRAVFDRVIEVWTKERDRAERIMLGSADVNGHNYARALKCQTDRDTIDRMLNILLEERVKVTHGDSD